MDEPIAKGWHLDKRVPIAFIVAILIQTFGFGWWAAKQDFRIAVLEADRIATADQGGRITRNEARLNSIDGSLVRIEDKLDRLIERSIP